MPHEKTASKTTGGKRRAVNLKIDDTIYWAGRERAAQRRMPNISALIEELLARELSSSANTRKAG